MNLILKYIIFVFTLIVLLLFVVDISEKRAFVVVLTDKKFIPDEIYIQLGDTITWINTGTRKHWPASDAHVTHGDYPQTSERDCLGSLFDVCRGLSPSEEWSFIFGFEGDWAYHDHIFPEITGTIFVENKIGNSIRSTFFNQDELTILPRVKKAVLYIQNVLTPINSKEFLLLATDEQKNYITELSKQSPYKAWAYLTNLVEFNNNSGHKLAHIIGSVLYQQNGIKAFKLCTKEFAYGCYHGIISGFLLENKNKDIVTITKECTQLFLDNTENDSPFYTKCIHGIGYASLLKTNFNIQDALIECGVLHGRNKSHCYDGVFIEYSFFVSPEQINRENIWQLCTDFIGKQRERCAYYQPNILRQVLGLDFAEINNICVSAPENVLKNICAQSVGILAAHVAQDEAEIRELCNFDQNRELSNKCLDAAGKEITFLRSN